MKDSDLFSLGRLADSIRQKKHPGNYMTFVIDRNITYTNVCISNCDFCAFYRSLDSADAYIMPKEEILKRVGELVKIGGTQVMLQGGLHPYLKIDYYTNLLESIKAHYDVHLHSFSPPEVVHIAKSSGLSIEEVLNRLKEAGLDSLPGGGAEILSDRVRRIISPNKIDTTIWLDVMRQAHKIGLRTTATMVYGMIETLEERINHLIKIRDLQDETGGFRAFIPWSFQPHRTRLNLQPATGIDYLKMVAISRLMLDNIDNIQAGWVTEGPKLAQLALAFGANDLGGILIDEVVVSSTGVAHKMGMKDMIRLIKDSGKIPAQRNTRYEILKVYY